MKEHEEKVVKKIMADMYGINYHSIEDKMRHDHSKEVDLKDLLLKLYEIRPMLYKFSNKLTDFEGKVDELSRLDLVRDLVRDAAHDLFEIYNIVTYFLTLK